MCQVKNMAELPEVKAFLPEAKERLEYLFARSSIVMPIIDQTDELAYHVMTESQVSHLAPLLVYPTLPYDTCIEAFLAWVQGASYTAKYSAIDHTIFFNMESGETDRFMASTLLHEVGHAIAAEKEGRILGDVMLRSEEARMEEELKMWLFDCHLAMLIGGESFRKQIGAEVQEILPRLAKGNFSFVPRSGQALDVCYGPLPTDKASSGRTNYYAVYCMLVALHMRFKPQIAYSYQLDLIKHIHRVASKQS